MRQRIADIENSKASSEEPGYNSALAERARKRMQRVDEMPADIRKCVYEYGLEIVQEFLNHGIRRATTIAYLIDVVRGADFANGQRRFKVNKGPKTKRNPIEDDDEYFVATKRGGSTLADVWPRKP